MKRAVVTIAVFLALGAVASWVVGAVFALRAPPPAPLASAPDHEGEYHGVAGGESWWCQVSNQLGRTTVVFEPDATETIRTPLAMSGDVVTEYRVQTMHWSVLRSRAARVAAMQFASGTIDLDHLVRSKEDIAVMDAQLLPRWARDPEELSAAGQVRRAFGWPVRALYYDAALTLDRAAQSLLIWGGWPVAEGWRFAGPGTVLPYRVLPVGLAIDTLAWAAILWTALLGRFAVRSSLRRRRGRCTACGYPIGDSAVCTECGRQIGAR